MVATLSGVVDMLHPSLPECIHTRLARATIGEFTVNKLTIHENFRTSQVMATGSNKCINLGVNIRDRCQIATDSVRAMLERMSLEPIIALTHNKVTLHDNGTNLDLVATTAGELREHGIRPSQIEETLVTGGGIHGSHVEIIPPRTLMLAYSASDSICS